MRPPHEVRGHHLRQEGPGPPAPRQGIAPSVRAHSPGARPPQGTSTSGPDRRGARSAHQGTAAPEARRRARAETSRAAGPNERAAADPRLTGESGSETIAVCSGPTMTFRSRPGGPVHPAYALGIPRAAQSTCSEIERVFPRHAPRGVLPQIAPRPGRSQACAGSRSRCSARARGREHARRHPRHPRRHLESLRSAGRPSPPCGWPPSPPSST